MGRYCGECGDWCENYDFSRTQWRKGEGLSRCLDCVDGCKQNAYVNTTYQCSECYREFDSQNNLDQHMQVHRPRSVPCPVCGQVRFRSGANAVQHVESGYCSGCRGQDNARQQIYNFASSKPAMRPFMSTVPQLEYGGGSGGGFGSVPDYPYTCPECSKSFRQLSQLLQHQDAKHTSTRMLGYY